jgi:hypothetical protein
MRTQVAREQTWFPNLFLYAIYLMTLSVIQSTLHQIIKWQVNKELQKACKEAVVT